MAKKPLEIDMIAGSQLRDTQGEMLSVEGADISELEAGKGRLNDNHGKGFFNAIGRVTGAKKIFKAEDCENDRQKYYWDKVKAPFIYVKGHLYDDEDHPNARAAAAILRNIHKTDTPLQLKASVEGGVLARGISDNSLLARTKIHSVALTFTPANNNTLVEPISLDKSFVDEAADMLLIKSVLHLAETNVPSFRHIVRDASATKVQNNLVKLVELMKELGIEGDITIPSKKHILEKALEQKIITNVQEIHEQVRLLNSDEDMEKGIKQALAGAATAAGIALAPQQTAEPKMDRAPAAVAPAPKKIDHQAVYSQVAKQYPVLGAIGQIESSGAQNYNHRTIASEDSPHHGMTAGGMFGMMPNTAAFILKKDPELAKKYPQLVQASSDMENNHKQFTDTFNKDPQAAADFAVSFYKRNKGKTKNDHMLVYSWLNGLKGSWNKYKDEGMDAIKGHPYVQNVMKEYDKLKPKKVEQNKPVKVPLKKALMAGYGGAGAPTSRTGGAVVQAESLDDGRPKLKYITCNNCGKEQVYAKYQVKCRECGCGLSLEKLYDAMRGNK
jgi:hypothetical protein